MGQDARINVHLCLLNCGGAQLSVAGSLRNYSCAKRSLLMIAADLVGRGLTTSLCGGRDGSFFAFEDRADHEIYNGGDKVYLGDPLCHQLRCHHDACTFVRTGSR